MTRLWIAIAVAIAIGSTYPFDFQPKDVDAAAIASFLDSCCQIAAGRNIMVNIAAYAAFGYLGLTAGGRRSSPLSQALLVAVVGTVLALALQIAQFYLPSRHESLQDVASALIGGLGGALLAMAFGDRPSHKAGLSQSQSAVHAAPPGQTGADTVPLTVNLRRSQAAFVDRLAAEMGVDPSEAYRQIVDVMLARHRDGGRSEGTEAPATPSAGTPFPPDGFTAQPAEPVPGPLWTKRTVMLDREQAQALKAAAEADGESLSRTARHLVGGFMRRVGGNAAPAAPQGASRGTRPAASDRQRRRGSGRRTPVGRWAALVALGTLMIAGILLASRETPIAQGPMILSEAPWSGENIDILFDHHTHTKHSDGALSVTEVVDLALSAGCGALAITDLSDGETTVGPLELETFRQLRRQLSGLLIFGGVEINMPSYGGREQATVIVDPESEEYVLPVLRDVAEDGVKLSRSAQDKKTADDELLKMAAKAVVRGGRLVMIYNHPSREDRDSSENYEDIVRWNAEAPIFIGFAGAPGHQNAPDVGSYRKNLLPIDRWDPAVAEIGGTWDRLLSEGHQLWGAIAGSGFHNERLDKIPCDFARTHVLASGFGYAEVLDALRAGTFWADHGKILQRLSFSAEITGLATPAYPGSVVSLGNEHPMIQARVDLERGPGAAGAPLQVEFIGNCRNGESQMLATERLGPDAATATTTLAPTATGADGKSCFLRARVRLDKLGEPDLMAYTNPIRFLLH